MKFRYLAILGLAASSLAVSTPSFAQRVSKITGGQLEKMCTSRAGLRMCDAYISGVMDGSVWQQMYTKHEKDPMDPAFCVPKEQTIAQVRSTLNAWVQAHPDKAKEGAGRVVFNALHANYACRVEHKPK